MSAKCKFTLKMEPLVFGLRIVAQNDKKIFEDEINKYFENANEIVDKYWMGGETNSRPINPIDVVSQHLGDNSIESLDSSARWAYSDDKDGYNSMKSSFIKSMVERIIFNPETQEWFDATKIDDKTKKFNHTDLAIFEYKMGLINSLRHSLGIETVTLDVLSDTINADLTTLLNDTLDAYRKKSESFEEHLDENSKLQYVILSNFNDLIAEHTPFIQIKRSYKQKGTQGVDMYDYVGPKANLRTSWTINEIVSASDQYSGLAKTLLNYFQEWDNGFLQDTSIGLDGFTGAMKALRTAILYSNSSMLSSAKAEYYRGAKMDIAKAIKDYLDAIDTGQIDSDYVTYLKQKLNGILYNIYENKSIPNDIKALFTGMFFKTVPLQYRTYGNYKNGFRGANLEETWLNNQNYRLQDSINGKIMGFRTNPDAWANVKSDYNIRLSEDSNNDNGDILFSFKENGNQIDLKIHYDVSSTKNRMTILNFIIDDAVTKTYNGKMADRLIYALTGYLITPEYRSKSRSQNKDNIGIISDFAGAIGISVLGAINSGNVQPFRTHGIIDTKENVINFYKGYLFSQLAMPASIAALVNGSETANTVKDVNGNNLPTNGLTSLAYEINEFLTRYEDTDGAFKYGLLAMNPDMITMPIIREGISIDGFGKKTSSFNVRELYECSIIFDFLNELDSGTIYMQPTTNADKTKTFVPGFKIDRLLTIDPNSTKYYNLKQLLSKVARGNGNTSTNKSESAIDTLNEILMTLKHNRLRALEQTLVDQYNDVLETKFSTLREVDAELLAKGYTINQLRSMFRTNSSNYTFIEEFTATKNKDIARINETLLNQIETFDGKTENKKFINRIDRLKRRFIEDLISDGFRLNPYLSKGGKVAYDFLSDSTGNKWIDNDSRNVILAKATKGKQVFNITKENIEFLKDSSYKIQLNPFLEAYQYAHMILSDGYNAASIGEYFVHANKNKKGSLENGQFDVSEWLEFSEASRWVSSVKRNVIPGASLHPLLQGLYDGVADTIKVSDMSDIDYDAFNMIGIINRGNVEDAMDGSGLANIWEILLEQNSLLDAGTKGYDLKTIGWDLDENGIPMMLKWAVYGITNERRRKGYLSRVDVEGLYKRMNDIQFDNVINLVEYFNKYVENGFIFKDPKNGQTIRVTDCFSKTATVNGKEQLIHIRRGIVNGRVVYLDKFNNIHDVLDLNQAELYTVNTIYDLDQFFGGCWVYKENEDKQLVSDDLNYRTVLDIICAEKLKSNFIAYAVNKSAKKVGVRNLNGKSVWFDKNSKLDYYTMSTKHIGLQMNAEHELLDAEVTEMTQMISALAENWYAGDLVKQIYKDIGAIVEESLASINVNIKTDDRDALRIKFGRSLIESFDKKEDTIGLAQAFLNKARVALKANEVPSIPFSAATINGAFIADVASRITKSGIRRKYDGIAAVLSPSYDMMSYFRYLGEDGNTKTTTAEYLPSEIRADLQRKGLTNFTNTDIYDLVHYTYVKDDFNNIVLNPFAEEVGSSYNLKQGDTITIGTILSDGTVQFSDPIHVESWDDYDKYVNLGSQYIIRKLKYAPRELQGADTTFSVDGQVYSIYNLNTVRATHELRKGNVLLADEILSDQNWVNEIVTDATGNINRGKSLQNIIQRQLEGLEKGFIHDSLFGGTTTVTNVNVVAAECIMGKMNAEKFGLQVGDQIDEILNNPNWFYDKFHKKYQIPLDDSVTFANAYLFTSTDPIIIHFGDISNPEQYNLSRNTQIRNIDGDLFIGDDILCKAEGTKLYNYTTGNKTYNVICISDSDQLNELKKSGASEALKYNIRTNTLHQYLDFTKDDRFNDVLNQYANKIISSDEVISLINRTIVADFTSELQRLSRQRYYAFRASLNIVGARIPTQAMQSFMPMKVVAFTEDTYNTIYVPRTQLWLQGSDLDIDKVYCLQYSIAKNGTLPTMSRLSEYYDPIEVLKLGNPNHVHYTTVRPGEDLANVFEVSYEDLKRTVSSDDSIPDQLKTFREIIRSGKSKITFVPPPDLEVTVPVNGKVIHELNAERELEFRDLRNRFMEFLNLHSNSNIHQNKEAALRNQVVAGIWEAVTKPSIQINANMPIDMGEAQKAGESSVLGDLEKHFSPDIASSIYKLQEQALGAKDVVGISAVSVKCFFAETTYMNMMLENFADLLTSGNEQQAMFILSNLIMENPLTGKAALVANANTKQVIDKLLVKGITTTSVGLSSPLNEAGWWVNNQFNIIKCLKDLGDRASIVDAALSDSGLLSASTDNMKELILPKLNATAEFVDIYTTLLATGVSFNDIANIMTSPMFTEMSKLTQSNILDNTTKGYRLKKALEFYLNKGTFSRIKKGMLENLFEKKEVGYVFEKTNGRVELETLLSATKNIDTLRKALNVVYRLRTQKLSNLASNDYYGNDEDLVLEDFFNGDLIENSNKIVIEDATLEDLNNIINYLEECINREQLFIKLDKLSSDPKYTRFGNTEQQLQKLNLILTKILPKTEEQQIFGRMLGVNQGLRTGQYDMYKMIRSIENFVNGRFKENRIAKTFDLMMFLSNDDYKKEMIDEYNKVKSSFNILHAITTVPHFAQMFNALYTNEFVQGTLSSKHEIVNNIARKLEIENPYGDDPYSRILTEKEYREVERYVNDWFITGWLMQQPYNFKVPTNYKVYRNTEKAETITGPEVIQLSDLYGMATFKLFMENVVIPNLQQMNRFNGVNEGSTTNSFIMSLEYGVAQNKKTHKWNKFYRLPLNMMTIGDSVLTTRIYEQYLRDFDLMSNDTFGGYKLGDLFFLYNLITNKDGFGQNSFTRIFENLVAAKRGSPLINSFYDYIAALDQSTDRTSIIEGMINNLEDLRARIQQNVAGTNISASENTNSILERMSTDFTFNMPYATRNWTSLVDKIYPIDSDLSWGRTTLDKSTIKSEILNNLKHLVSSDNVVVAPQSYFDENFADDPLAISSPAFIHNGIIYIKQTNLTTAETIAHEFSHVILAALRFGTEEQQRFYYDVLGKINLSEAKQVFGEEISRYQQFRTGIDLKEEVFAKYIENWMSNKISTIGTLGRELINNNQSIIDAINKVFGTELDTIDDVLSFTNSDLRDAIDAIGSSLFQLDWSSIVKPDFLIDAQKVASLKHFLATNTELIKLMHC